MYTKVHGFYPHTYGVAGWRRETKEEHEKTGVRQNRMGEYQNDF